MRYLMIFFMFWVVVGIQAQNLVSSSFDHQSSYFLEQAKVHSTSGEQSEAWKYLDSALLKVSPEKDPEIYYQVLLTGAGLAADHADYRRSAGFLERVISDSLFTQDSARLGRVLIEIADFHLNFHQYGESMKLCNLALPLLDKNRDMEGKARALLIMYNNSYHSSNDSSNLDYLEQAIGIAMELKDSSLLGEIYSTRGLNYSRAGDQQNALRNYTLARSYLKKQEEAGSLDHAILHHLCYTMVDSVEAAGKLSEYIVSVALKTNQPAYLRNGYRGRAWYYGKKGMKDSTTFYLDKSDEFHKLYGKLEASPGYLYSMYEVCMLINDYERAIGYLNRSLDQYRTLIRGENTGSLSEMRAQFDYQLQKERILKLRMENQLEKERTRRQLMVILVIGIILIVSVAFAVAFRKQLKRLKEAFDDLVRKNLELDNLNSELTEARELMRNKQPGPVIRDEDEILNRLKQLLDKERVYARQDLSLSHLAEILGTNTTYLSSIINNRFGMSFKTLLNKYRIAEARKLLVTKEYDNFSIEGIANEVGYQSRSTFYQEFKNSTGVTPKDYIEGFRRIGNADPR